MEPRATYFSLALASNYASLPNSYNAGLQVEHHKYLILQSVCHGSCMLCFQSQTSFLILLVVVFTRDSIHINNSGNRPCYFFLIPYLMAIFELNVV